MNQAELEAIYKELNLAPGESDLDRWRREAKEQERRCAVAREQQRAEQAEQQQSWAEWVASEIESRVAAAVAAEHERMMEIVGAALGQALADERKVSKDELGVEVKRLWVVLTELQSTIKALSGADRAKPLDLPPLPRSAVN